MGPTLIALGVSVLLTLAGAFAYSSYMEKSGKSKKADTKVEATAEKTAKSDAR